MGIEGPTGMRIDMCTDMLTDMCLDMCMDIQMDMSVHEGHVSHEQRRA